MTAILFFLGLPVAFSIAAGFWVLVTMWRTRGSPSIPLPPPRSIAIYEIRFRNGVTAFFCDADEEGSLAVLSSLLVGQWEVTRC